MADIGSVLGSAGIGGAIGKAIVTLELDSKKYLAEMNAAKAETTASTNTMSGGLTKFAGVAKTAFLGAGVAAVAFAVSSVKAAIEANDAQLKLQNTFANNPMLSDSSAAAFTRQADALRDLTGADDEAIIGAQSLVGQFDLTGTQVQELIPLIVDLSAKMGVDLDAAAKAVGKSATGTVAGLKRYGIQVDETAAKTDAFSATMDALTKVQGFAADRADAEPWRVLGAQFEELQETLGQELLPFVQQLTEALIDALPIIEEFGSLLAKLPTISPGILQLLGALGKFQAAGEAALTEGLVPVAEKAIAFGQELYTKVAPQVEEFAAGFVNLGHTTGDLTHHFDTAGHMVQNFAGLSNKALNEMREGAHESITSAIGDLDSIEKKWHDTSESAVRAMELMAKQAKQMGRDFKALDKEAIPEQLKAFLIEQGPAAVHEFVTGTEKQKARFIAAWRGYENAVTTAVRNMRGIASKGGAEVGAALGQGIVQAFQNYAPTIYNTVDQVIQNTIARARAAAQAESPSKKMFELGVDLMTGLQNGITDHEQEVIDAAQRVIDRAIKEMEKQAEALQSRLDKILAKAADMKSAVQGGFSSFLDISGAFAEGQDIGAFFQQQLAGAQEFAKVLKQLQKAGASSALLQQIAQAGPEAMPFAQQLLASGTTGSISDAYQQIADLAGKTADQLSNAYFGEKIDALQSELKGIREELRTLNQPRRLIVELRGGDQALQQLIRQVIRDMSLNRAPV